MAAQRGKQVESDESYKRRVRLYARAVPGLILKIPDAGTTMIILHPVLSVVYGLYSSSAVWSMEVGLSSELPRTPPRPARTYATYTEPQS